MSTSNVPTFPVVALAAGGVAALADVVEDLPPEFPAAVLALLHGRQAGVALAAILGRRASLPVRDAEDGEFLRPGAVLVAPPARQLVVLPGDRVRLLRSNPLPGMGHAADALFVSLAVVCGPRAVAVALKGLGSEVTGGLRAVKESGGTALAEIQGMAEAGGMPAATATGVVDRVLPPGEIAEVLVELVGRGRSEAG